MTLHSAQVGPTVEQITEAEATTSQTVETEDCKRAVLVIHGIGRQQPFQALDSFVNGLRNIGENVEVSHTLMGHENAFDHFITLKNLPGLKGSLDIYEYYWAPLTTKSASFLEVVIWLAKTGFTPVSRLSFNLPLILHRAHEKAKENTPPRTVSQCLSDMTKGRLLSKPERFLAWYFLKEIGQVVFVLLACIFLAGLAAGILVKSSDLVKEILTRPNISIANVDGSQLASAFLFIGLLGAILTLSIGVFQQARDLIRLFTSTHHRWNARKEIQKWNLEIRGRSLFLKLSLPILSILIALIVSWVLLEDPSTTLCVFDQCLQPVYQQAYSALEEVGRESLAWTVGLLFIAFWIKRILVDYLADIAVYTTTDERSPFYKIRKTILHEASRKLRWLLRHYPSVTVAGHSLGSVIGYDAINKLHVEAQVSENLIEDSLNNVASFMNKDLEDNDKEQVQRLIGQLAKINSADLPFDNDHSLREPLAQLMELIHKFPPTSAARAVEFLNQLEQNLGKRNSPETPALTLQEYRRLQTFISFGSPLNKVLYFFRRKLAINETVRAHIVNELYGFRRLKSKVENSEISEHGRLDIFCRNGNSIDELFWLNVYSPFDPISAELVFFENTYEYRRWYLTPGYCHLRYWYDSEFYEEVLAAIKKQPRKARQPI